MTKCVMRGVRNKKQCSRQLQCEVPCRNITNSSLSSLFSEGGPGAGGSGSSVSGGGGGEGRGLRGRGRGHFIHLAIYCTTTSMVLRPEGTSHNKISRETRPNASEAASFVQLIRNAILICVADFFRLPCPRCHKRLDSSAKSPPCER